jgi:hypothetical protein
MPYRLPPLCFVLLLTAYLVPFPSVAIAAGADLLQNGSFEKTDNSGFPEGWRFGDPVFNKIQTEGGRKFLRVHSDVPVAAITRQQIAIDSATASVNVKARMRARNLKIGDVAWKTGRISLTFTDANNEHVGDWDAINLKGDQDWTDVAVTLDVPAGAVAFEVACGIWDASGAVDFDDLSVTAERKEPAQAGTPDRPTDAKLPAAQAAEFGKMTTRAVSTQRGEVDLNGVWKFVPAAGETLKEPKGFGYIKVPAPWNKDASIVARGGGEPWTQFKGAEVAQAWYERPITVPAGWAGKGIVLDLDRVSTDAVVYLDGNEVGQIRWPGGQVDLTDVATPGKEQTLRVRVLAVDDRTEVTNYMGYADEPKAAAKLDNRGIIGRGAKLLARPIAAYVDDVYVRPSVREKKVEVDVELKGIKKAGG